MRCSKCGTESTSGRKFCAECGSPLANRCAKCGAENSRSAKFCEDCGAHLGVAGDAGSLDKSSNAPTPTEIIEATTPEQLEEERKTVTALFADIKGSTELMADLDPEEARAIIDPALKLMIEAVRRYDGYVVQSTGDGIFALFGAPVAHEDHPQRALYAALRMQEELKRYSGRLREAGNLPIEGRIGVNTGEVVVRSIATGGGRVEYTPIGHTTNLASRMQALAPTGSIATSEQTRRLVEGYFALKPLGPTRVKGVSEPVNVWEVAGLGPLRTRLQRSAGRGLTKFVGREREMETLKHAADQAGAGHGQIVGAVAEPGVGKSRLIFEFKARNQSGWMVLETFSISHGKASAYLPIIELLHGYFAIEPGDEGRKRREKVTGRLLALDRTLEDTLAYLLALLGITEGDDPLAQMDGQVKKRRTLEAIKRIFVRESLNQPLMVIFEDLHWIDEQTQEFLNLLAESIGTAKILLLVNYRPEYAHQWNSKTYYTQLRLDPLGEDSAEEMLAALVGDGIDVRPLKRLILERTGGNAFFMEEIVQSLFEDQVLQRNGIVKLAKSMNAVKVPTTVQGVIAARIDRLTAGQKELLQTLAVLGREFTFGLVRSVTLKPHDNLNEMLSELQLAEFIYEQPTTGDTEYIFKHALTQEVAYGALLVERRKLIHQQAGTAMEEMFAANLSDHYGELAHHYQHSVDKSKAVAYLRLAGEQAMSRSAYSEAVEFLNTALELLPMLPATTERDQTESALRLSLVSSTIFDDLAALMAIQTSESLERARALCERVRNDRLHAEVLSALAYIYANRIESTKVHAVCDELLRVATGIQDIDMIGRARFWEAFSLFWQGSFLAALENFDRAYELPKNVRSKRELSYGGWQNLTRSLGALTLFIVGYPDKAILRSREGLAMAREGKEHSSLAPILFWCFFLNLSIRDPRTAYPQVLEAAQAQREHGFAALNSIIEFWRGYTLVQIGQIEEGLHELTRYGSHLERFVRTPVGTFMFVALADTYLTVGRRDEGLKAVASGLEALKRDGIYSGQPELLRMKGELLLLNGNKAQEAAAECFRCAIEVSRKQSAKSWELRATTSITRLLISQSRHDEARAMLADIYSWFTEGFDTPDLKDAKALLDELGA
jgi:class 3 adenylate cyclase/tetratricopeptide (TPR) repeat protein